MPANGIPHYRRILSRKPVVDWFEIVSENFMVDSRRPLEILDQILEQYRAGSRLGRPRLVLDLTPQIS